MTNMGQNWLLDPLWDLDKFWDRFYDTAVGLWLNLRFYNTTALKRMKYGAKLVTPAVGLRQILRFYYTAALIRMKCGAKFVRTADLIRGN